jgi:hypothetical protein
MVRHLNTPGKASADEKMEELVNVMVAFTVKSARSFLCFSPLTVLQATLVIRTSPNSFPILSSCFSVTLQTLEAAKLAVCLFPAVSQNMDEQIPVPSHESASMGMHISRD